MLFTPNVTEDISRYYRGTYIKFHETGDRLFYIQTVNGQLISGTDQNGTEFQLFLSEEFPYEVDYILPKKSYFQWQSHACLLQRIPAKQYQRGLSEANTQIKGLSPDGSSVSMIVGFESLKAYVEKQAFPSFLEALTNRDNHKSTALSSRFALTALSKSIYLDDVLVASVSTKDKQITMVETIFHSDIASLVATSGFKVI